MENTSLSLLADLQELTQQYAEDVSLSEMSRILILHASRLRYAHSADKYESLESLIIFVLNGLRESLAQICFNEKKSFLEAQD